MKEVQAKHRPLVNIMELSHLKDVYLAVKKLIIDKTQNIFIEHSGFIKYFLNKLDWII